MIAGNRLHNGVGRGNFNLRVALHEPQKMLLQGILVGLVLLELNREGIVVGKGEGIGGVVDQLAQGVVVKQVQFFLSLQTGGDGTHETAGVLIVVTPKPLASDGAFQVCSRVSIRLNTADPKSGLAVLRYVRHVVLHQILRNA